MANPYLESYQNVVAVVKAARTDGKIDASEVSMISGALLAATNDIASAMKVFDGEDETDLTDAAGWAYDTYVEPINLPGPDAVVDPFVKGLWLSIVRGVIAYYKAKAAA